MKKILAPSLLAGDHGNLRKSLSEVEQDGRQWIHLDLMDGHFVPNLSFGPQTVADLRPHSKLFFDFSDNSSNDKMLYFFINW